MADALLKQAPIRGLQTAWMEYPNASKPLFFLIHGYPDTPDTFSQQIETLKQRFHLVLPFARGVGPSAKGRDSSRSRISAVVLDLLQIAEIIRPGEKSKIFVLGHDLGAIYGWAFAEALADRLGALVMMGGLGIPQAVRRFKNTKQLRKSWYIFGMQIPVLPEMILSRLKAPFLKFAYDSGQLPHELRQQNEASASLQSVVVNPISHYRALFRDALEEWGKPPRRIQAPLLLICGHRDAFVMTPTVAEFEPFADDVLVRIIEGNHWIHREKSAQVNKAVHEFLSKVLTDAQSQ